MRKPEEGAPKNRPCGLNAGVSPACARAGFSEAPFARGPRVVGAQLLAEWLDFPGGLQATAADQLTVVDRILRDSGSPLPRVFTLNFFQGCQESGCHQASGLPVPPGGGGVDRFVLRSANLCPRAQVVRSRPQKDLFVFVDWRQSGPADFKKALDRYPWKSVFSAGSQNGKTFDV